MECVWQCGRRTTHSSTPRLASASFMRALLFVFWDVHPGPFKKAGNTARVAGLGCSSFWRYPGRYHHVPSTVPVPLLHWNGFLWSVVASGPVAWLYKDPGIVPPLLLPFLCPEPWQQGCGLRFNLSLNKGP